MLIPAVGLLTGVVALTIAHVIALLQELFWGSGENLLSGAQAATWWHRLLVPVLGGALVGLLVLVLRREVRGSGTPGLMYAVGLRGGRIRLREEAPAITAGILTVSTGGSLGREGPIIEFASALGSGLGRMFSLSTHQVRVLVCCAAAGAISAVYNAPIGGSIFVMEIVIGTFALDIFGPVVIASVLSTLVFRSATGELPRFVVPSYDLVSAWELPAYLLLGVLCGFFAVGIIRFMAWTADAFHSAIDAPWLRPIVGFLLLGTIGIAFPHVFGNGYEAVNLALREQLPLALLLVLPFAKLLATAVTRGSGGAGGMFTPTLMMGAMAGGAFGYGVHAAFPTVTAEHGAYAIVGMGAVLAGTTHAPFMAIMMIFEQTNSYPIILPLMLGCIVSNVIARRIEPASMHVDSLRRRGVELGSTPEADVMRSLQVRDVMHEDVEAVTERAPFGEVVDYFLRNPRNFLYVTDDERHFVGAIPLHAIKNTLSASHPLDIVIAADLVEPFGFVTPDQPLADAMEAFWEQHSERMPVLTDAESRRLVGWISQRDLIGIYNQEILKKQTAFARFTLPTASGEERASFVELPEGFVIRTLIVPPALDGRTIGDLALRNAYAVQVLQIRRHVSFRRRQRADLPGPASVLRAWDRLVVIGAGEKVQEMQDALGLGTDPRTGAGERAE